MYHMDRSTRPPEDDDKSPWHAKNPVTVDNDIPIDSSRSLVIVSDHEYLPKEYVFPEDLE